MIGITKNQIYETVFETIKESTEWGTDEESKIYGHWVDGVVTMVDNLLNKIKEEKNKKSLENKKGENIDESKVFRECKY